MSNRFEESLRADGPLTDRELLLAKRILSDPFSFPAEFWTALKARLSQDPPDLTWDSILGFDNSAARAVPAQPVIDLSVDISAANTDLPRPGAGYSHVWMLNPGGGSLRTIGDPVSGEGTRLTLKGGFIGNTVLKHNDLSGPGGSARPLFLHDQLNLMLRGTESIELVYIDTLWQDVGVLQNAFMAKVRRDIGGSQSIPDVTPTAISFDTEDSDRGGLWVPGQPTRLTIPVDGFYRFWGAVSFDANATGYRELMVLLNGAIRVAYNTYLPSAFNAAVPHLIVNGYHPCSAGDYVELVAAQASGAALLVNCGDGNFYQGFAAERVA